MLTQVCNSKQLFMSHISSTDTSVCITWYTISNRWAGEHGLQCIVSSWLNDVAPCRLIEQHLVGVGGTSNVAELPEGSACIIVQPVSTDDIVININMDMLTTEAIGPCQVDTEAAYASHNSGPATAKLRHTQ